MSVTSALGNQAKLLWQLLGFFQKPYLRFLHAIIAVLVILQILSSFAMHMLSSGQINPALSSWLASWYHILSGLARCHPQPAACGGQPHKARFSLFFPVPLGGYGTAQKGHSGQLALQDGSAAPERVGNRRTGARARRAAARRAERPDLVHPLAERAHRSQGWRWKPIKT